MQRGGVIAAREAIATCGAFEELQGEEVAGRGVVTSLRASREAGRLARAAALRASRGVVRRAETTTFLAVA